MRSTISSLVRRRVVRRAGIAAFLFFLAKGLVWVALGVAGYTAWAGH